MPPVPPARRHAPGPVAAARPLTAKQSRFLLLFFHHDPHPVAALSQQQFAALHPRGRKSLAWITPQTRLEPHASRLLEAYYASGYKPSGPFLGDDVIDYEQDLSRAMAIGEANKGTLSTLLSYLPATSDKNVVQRLIALNDAPELRSGDKIRLEALRLLLQLKGHLRDDQAAVQQATQIIIHTSQEPAIKPQNEPQRIEIAL